MSNLRSLARYLKGHELKHVACLAEPLGRADAFSERDWMGCSETKRSNNGVVISRGGSLVMSSSSRQAGLSAMSSGEVELRAAEQAALDIEFVRHFLEDMKVETVGVPRLWMDSKVVLRAAQR